jgi:hypothetical protein
LLASPGASTSPSTTLPGSSAATAEATAAAAAVTTASWARASKSPSTKLYTSPGA